MYHGEVNVAQEELNTFLAVAEDLKVKGLTQNGSDKSSNKMDPLSAPRARQREPPERGEGNTVKRAKLSPQFPSGPTGKPSFQNVDDDDIQEVLPVKSEPVSSDSVPQTTSANNDQAYASLGHPAGIVADPNMDNTMYSEEYGDYANYEDGPDANYDGSMMAGAATADGNKDLEQLISDSLVQNVTPDGHNIWCCNQCGKESKHKRVMRSHVETHFPGCFTIACTICGKVAKNKDSLRGHMRKYHKEVPD